MKTAIVILGNQLLANHPALEQFPDADIIMIEADDLLRRHRYHSHKLILVLSSMRNYNDTIVSDNRISRYITYVPDSSFISVLHQCAEEHSYAKLVWMQPSDRGASRALQAFAQKHNLRFEILPNRQFMLTHGEFDEWYTSQATPRMESFYRWHRKRSSILMDNNKPVGDKWNFDHDNRAPLPNDMPSLPKLSFPKPNNHTVEVSKLVNEHFVHNPGSSADFWLPTTHSQAEDWLDNFIETRLTNFGTYEDAMRTNEPFLYHSVLSPLINIGLLEPQEVVARILNAYADNQSIGLNNVEGFIRQVIGWREYMHGLYWQNPELIDANFFGFTRELEDWWYDERFREQELPPPIMDVLERTHRYGYNHHIERLMVLGNWFLLNEYDPRSVYEWFSAMYVDAYEWVMVPNVQGMSQYADGGMVATKPYISGGNYLQKMGNWWPSLQAAKDSEFNTLYWQFLYKHRDKLADNHRMSIALKQAERMHNRK